MAARDRATALSIQLARTHQALRDRLGALRGHLLSGSSPPSAAVLEHCAGFCSALERHHTGEDEGLFPVLRREFPELTRVIDKLAEDHWLIAGILRRVRELITAAAAGADPAAVVGELDGLAAIMESHFAFEERRISASIDALGAGLDGGGAAFDGGGVGFGAGGAGSEAGGPGLDRGGLGVGAGGAGLDGGDGVFGARGPGLDGDDAVLGADGPGFGAGGAALDGEGL